MDADRKLARFDSQYLADPTVFWGAMIFFGAAVIGVVNGNSDAVSGLILMPIVAVASKFASAKRDRQRLERSRLERRAADLGWRIYCATGRLEQIESD
jgi:hypothetical protein